MDGFESEVLKRLPLAEAVWTLMRHVVSPEFARDVFDRHRGTGSELQIEFGTLVELVADALTQHLGSGRKSFESGQRDGRLKATIRAAYGKLGRVRLELSQAFLSQATLRLNQVLPTQMPNCLPQSLRAFSVIVMDGKKIKNLAKRVKALRPLQGKPLGGKGVVALLLNTQLVVAMEASPDGEANDAPLAPDLLAQVEALLAGPKLWIADRQFCDLTIPAKMVERGDHFLIRFTKKMRFFAEKTATWRDSQGREVIEEWGWLGADVKRRMFVRRLTLVRPGEEDVSVVTDLLDAQRYPGGDLLDVYLQRWSIERVFQQVTEVLSLSHLIGSAPQGALFQFALCLLLYNLLQVIRAYVAQLEQRDAGTISSELLFDDIREQMVAANVLLKREELAQYLDRSHPPAEVRNRLHELLRGQWSPKWIKAPPKRRSLQTTVKKRVAGGHCSAWKILQAARAKPPS
jgi:hypothetical protein